MIETPTELLLGKASRVIEEISKGIGASYVSMSIGESGFLNLYLTMSMLSKNLSDINFIKEVVVNYFGLDISQLTFEVEGRYSKMELKIKNESQSFEIKIQGE